MANTGCIVFCICTVVVGFVVLIIVLVQNSNGDGWGGGYGGGYSSSGGGYRSRSYGGGRGRGGGRGGGGRGGCFDDTTIVWTKNETQLDEYAKQVMAKNVEEGDLVATIDLSLQPNERDTFMWTRATDVTISNGSWKAHSFIFNNGHHLTVTSPHLMIIWKDGIAYFKRADQIEVGDKMKVGKLMTRVTRIKNHMIASKVAIETEDGTIQVNGVLASGLCDNNPEVINRVANVGSIVKKYKSSHFGVDYNTMCMDSFAWKNAYMVNNGFKM